jgi:ubiquinone/menaquinone biosynthesis C-methylase UbiE
LLDEEPPRRSNVTDHYAHGDLVAAIREGLRLMGKTTSTVTIDDLAPVDEFHIGGRKATEELVTQIRPSLADHVLDIGSGLGGAARFVADRYSCRVTGIDLTREYVEAGKFLCEWVGLDCRVSLYHASALAIPFSAEEFNAAYMQHVGMNIEDKIRLCSEAARVLRPGSLFGVYDVMRTGDGKLSYPLPWATSIESNAIAEPEQYRSALRAAGFEIVSERNRRDFALAYFHQLQSKMSGAEAPPPLGLHTLMGDRRRDQVRNMIENISAGRIAPFELIARKGSSERA